MNKKTTPKKTRSKKVNSLSFLEKPCFIVGHPRSGTNLLNKLLDGHKNILTSLGAGKTHILRKLYYINWSKLKKNNILYLIDREVEFLLLSKNQKKFLSKVKSHLHDFSNYKEIIRAILLGMAEYKNYDLNKIKVWTEKNVNLEFYLHNAFSSFAQPRFIFIVRDPRDIWVSWEKLCLKEGFKNDFKQFCLNINTHLMEEFEAMASGYGRFDSLKSLSNYYRIDSSLFMKLISRFYGTNRNPTELNKITFKQGSFKFSDTRQGRFAWNYKYMLQKALDNNRKYPANFKIIKYEDLVYNTEITIKKITKFLNIKFYRKLLFPTEEGKFWACNSMHGNRINKVSPFSVGKYKNEITGKAKKNIEIILNEEMRIFDYK